MFAFYCDVFSFVVDAAENESGFDFDLDVQNKVSTCDEDFSLKGLNRGEHKITVVIRAYDGRTKTLEQIVNL